jgi:hypothetical protein
MNNLPQQPDGQYTRELRPGQRRLLGVGLLLVGGWLCWEFWLQDVIKNANRLPITTSGIEHFQSFQRYTEGGEGCFSTTDSRGNQYILSDC